MHFFAKSLNEAYKVPNFSAFQRFADINPALNLVSFIYLIQEADHGR